MNPIAKNVLAVISGVVVGSPMWFNVTDLLLAYIPMGYLGGILAGGKRPQTVYSSHGQE